jgi:hypothetical protein
MGDDSGTPSPSEAAPSGQGSRAAAGRARTRGTTLFEAAAAASAGEDFFGGAADSDWLAPNLDGAPAPSSWWDDLAPPAEVRPLAP